MSDEIVEPEVDVEELVEVDVDENEPVFFKIKTLNLVASAARILSWIVLVAFVLVFGGNIYNLKELTQGAAISEIIANPTIRVWILSNIVIPLFSGLTFFVVLQGVCSVIDALLEVDFNTRETK